MGISLVEKTLSITGKGELHAMDIARGSFLAEISGYFACSSGGAQKHDLVFSF
jgi:hypothetical protein